MQFTYYYQLSLKIPNSREWTQMIIFTHFHTQSINPHPNIHRQRLSRSGCQSEPNWQAESRATKGKWELAHFSESGTWTIRKMIDIDYYPSMTLLWFIARVLISFTFLVLPLKNHIRLNNMCLFWHGSSALALIVQGK